MCELQEQILYWEKKVQLEKEAQAAIDPTGGDGNESEQQKMKNEIHRMELRLRALRRNEEDMIKEMELAIEKREMISIANRGKKTKAHGGATQGQLRKQVKTMKVSLRTAQRETADLENGLREGKSVFDEVSAATQRKARNYERIEVQVQEMQGAINTALYDKQRSSDAIAKQSRMLKRYRAVAGQRLALDAERIAGELAQAEQQRQAIQAVIGTVQGEFPQLEEVLSRVLNLGEV